MRLVTSSNSLRMSTLTMVVVMAAKFNRRAGTGNRAHETGQCQSRGQGIGMRRNRQFVGGSRRTRDMDQKGQEKVVSKPLVLIEQLDVVEVTRVLATAGSIQFATVQILK